ncbi:MAG: hypothetical protein JWP95_2174, partial [Actinotalea sp.]|nr:hypothetical protein [Actinotalea sp.]
ALVGTSGCAPAARDVVVEPTVGAVDDPHPMIEVTVR